MQAGFFVMELHGLPYGVLIRGPYSLPSESLGRDMVSYGLP